MRTEQTREPRMPRWKKAALLALPVLLALAFSQAIRSDVYVGENLETSFSVCEAEEGAEGVPRPECEASDVRFQAELGTAADPVETGFGFSIAAGHVNGDEFEDLVVGDPVQGRVYVFFGRLSVQASYGLDPETLDDRMVSPESEADVVFYRQPVSGELGSLGFSVAVGTRVDVEDCATGEQASPLLLGAPGAPGGEFGGPGTAVYIPAGALCMAATDPPTPVTLDPFVVGQAFRAPLIGNDDEFGYSVAFARLLTNTGTDEDAIVGARGARGGDGSVAIFPVNGGAVETAVGNQVRIAGLAGDGLGEVLAVGDLDLDFDSDGMPFGDRDDLVIGAVGHENGKALLVDGPLSPDEGEGGLFTEETGYEIRPILGEEPGDFFGFSVAVSAEGRLAVGAVFADNTPPPLEGSTEGGDPLTNVASGARINGGKVYAWDPGVLDEIDPELDANGADLVFVARRSADQAGFALTFGDLNSSGDEELIVSARREDGSGLTVNEIDQGTAYIVFDDTALTSPVDLNFCETSSDCTGVSGVNVMLFGGDRERGLGDEIGYAATVGDYNDDGFDDLFLSSLTQNRVYLVTLADGDEDREDQGRNIRDGDDDGDDDPDATDCAPFDPDVHSEVEEITCNGVDENCNGMDDDTPDADSDGFDACGLGEEPADCDDEDPLSYPEATELCDGNDNACGGGVLSDETDLDGDGYVECADWDDVQGDQPEVLGGDDCRDIDSQTFPGAAPNEAESDACMQDRDEDDYGDIDPAGAVIPGSDCDDDDGRAFPGAATIDGSPVACTRDRDEDGYGDAEAVLPVVAGSDCDDLDANTRPGAPEVCDGNDNSCSGDIPVAETDVDGDDYAACAGWNDIQGDNQSILGGDDCLPDDGDVFPGAAPNEAFAAACMRDADGDDYGDLDPPAGATAGTDCDDDSFATFPGAAEIDGPFNCMKDLDADGYGDDSVSLPVARGTDCNDDDPGSYSGATEIPDDDVDQDCNGSDSVTCYVDNDLDGFGGATPVQADDGNCDDPGESALDTDCDDDDETVFPDNPEIPDDDIDQDCNGSDSVTCYVDTDGDGHGTASGATVVADDGSCDAEDQESASDDDCDDADSNTYPGATESCDGNDNTCAGAVPADERDPDADGYAGCTGWDDTQGDNPAIRGGGDCATADPLTYPGAAANESAATACMRDADGDEYGDVSPPAGVAPGTDCDDGDPAAFLGAAEAEAPLNCMRDADSDGYGDLDVTLPVLAGTDCDDGDPGTFLGAAESCDGNDNACSGALPAEETDGDGDGYVACAHWNDVQGDDPGIAGGGDCDPSTGDTHPGAAANEPFASACMKDSDGDQFGDSFPPAGVIPGTDCDDGSAVTYPGAAEIDAPLNCMRDADDDGYGDTAAALPVVPGRDCSDGNANVNPATLEGPLGDPTCSDGLDNDCDGDFDDADAVCAGTAEVCPDADSDSYTDCVTDPTCDPTGTVCGDCDDGDATAHPGAAEVCDNQDNNCDNVTDEGFDADSDGYTTCDLPTADCDDGNALVSPGLSEICGDSLDNDCNAGTPDIFDGDSDGAACDTDCNDNDAALNQVDADSDGASTCAGDCDDTNASISPLISEICDNGVDDDCSAATADIFDDDSDGALCDVDCDDGDATLNLTDGDSDSFNSCAGDCDDTDAAVNPAATEDCDGVDNNCDGAIDESYDLDSDGYSTCAQPLSDCDDTNASVNPGVAEVCNDSVDNDCDLATPDLFDSDSDGALCDSDCDDNDGASYPGAAEICDGNDNACAGSIDASEVDGDGDGWVECTAWSDTQGDDPATLGGGDCDPLEADTHPEAAYNEVVPSACMEDEDGDGYGDLQPPAGVIQGTDCDDGSALTFVGAAQSEPPGTCMRDADDDGYGDQSAVLPVVPGADCDDTLAAVSPAGTEGPFGNPTCGDSLDNDCDTLVDDQDPECIGVRSIRGQRKPTVERFRSVGRSRR